MVVSIFLSFLNNFFNKFSPAEKCGVTQHCSYRNSLTLNTKLFKFKIKLNKTVIIFVETTFFVLLIGIYREQKQHLHIQMFLRLPPLQIYNNIFFMVGICGQRRKEFKEFNKYLKSFHETIKLAIDYMKLNSFFRF